jgi:hypothetical protein
MSIRIARRGVLPALLAFGGALTLSATASAEPGYSTPITLRTGPPGAGVELEDIAAAGRRISVVWEESQGENSRILLRTSTDGGRTFRARRLVDDRHASNASTDVCEGFAWVASTFRNPEDASETDGLGISGYQLSGPVTSGELVVESGGAQHVDETDFACVGGRRRAVAWVDRDFEGTSTVRIRFLPFVRDIEDVPPDVQRSFPADAFTSVAVAAVGDRVWLAWETTSHRIRIMPFDVGPGPDFPVTPRAAMTLPDMGEPTGNIALGARGSRLLIAYAVNADTFARLSTNRGARFGPRRKLLDGIFGGDLFTNPVSADVRGGRAVVHAAELGGLEDLVTIAHRFRSSDDGMSWSDAERDSDGFRMGAFTRRLVEAWDRSTSDAGPKRIRFHRQR